MRRASFILLWSLVIAVQWAPLAYAFWLSFAPHGLLLPPSEEWSGRWYRLFFSDGRWMSALGRSMMVSAASALLAVLFGTLGALALPRGRRWNRPLSLALALPALMPPLALGLSLLPTLHLVRLQGTLIGLILVYALLGAPLVCFLVQQRQDQIGEELLAVARGLGATPWQAFRQVTLPLLSGTLVVGGGTVALLTWNESILAILLCTPRTETLPAVIWPQLRYAPSPLIAVAAVVSVVSVGLVVVVGGRFGGTTNAAAASPNEPRRLDATAPVD